MSIWSCATQNQVSENFARVDALRFYLWKETHSGMNVIPVSCKWRLSYLVWNQSTSTFSKSLKLELIYLVINKSGQLLNLFVCVIFLIRFEVSQPTPTLQTPNHLPPPPSPTHFFFPPIPHSLYLRVKKPTDFTQIMIDLQVHEVHLLSLWPLSSFITLPVMKVTCKQ